jgi:hypothetical protein
MELADIDMNDGDERDILGITLNMCDFIEDRWFDGNNLRKSDDCCHRSLKFSKSAPQFN